MRIGSDTGGTFTDLVAEDGSVAKVPSTPDDPGRAVRAGLASLAGGRVPDVLAHGTTVATNALLERRGAAVALVTTAGFADVIEIARQDRPSLYDPEVVRPEPLVPPPRRVEVPERLAADGSELVPLGHVPAVPADADAVAVCLLHSDLDPAHERAVAGELEGRGLDVSASCDVSPEYREYERTVTTVVNAYLRPVCRRYLRALSDAAGRVEVMTSAGGLVPADTAAERPASLVLSGPAGGVLAGARAAVANGFPDAVTLDMGGTSTDVCLVLDGQPAPASEREVAGLPVRLPSLDVHTIGAGGGSVARLDDGGALVVGPRSAGAEPGPACYGRGGTEATVTDADLVAGRIPPDAAFPGLGALDAEAARRALDAAGVTAEGVLAVVDAAMEEAIRVVTVERGVDPRGLALVAFGGAGPLHACALAGALGMAAVVVPARAGVLSAVGILGAPLQVDLVRSVPDPLDHDSAAGLAEGLRAEAVDQLVAQVAGRPRSSVAYDCRYVGQSHELPVADPSHFHAEHRLRNGYDRPDHPVEVVAVRARAWVPTPVGPDDLRAPARSGAVGPAVLAEEDCTIWVPEGWVAEPGAAGALVLRPVPDPVSGPPSGPRSGPPTGPASGPSDVAAGNVPSVAPAGPPSGPPADRLVLDPASLQVLIARLTGIATEMGAALQRSAFSPNIKERADHSAALFTPEGELLVQAEHIPVHLGSMPASVAAAIERFGPGTPGWEALLGRGPGHPRTDDRRAPGAGGLVETGQIVLNDPFAGGTHLNDVTLVAPCVVGGRLVGWVANRAHHADVGGAAPGSMPAEATEVYAEGLRIPPVVLTDEVRALFVANSRTPDERAGDLDAQVGANRRGAERLAELADAPLAEVLVHGERRMRAALRDLPDGSWAFADVVDSFGPGDHQQVETHVRVRVTVAGDGITFDLSDSDPQREGNVNAVRAVTVSAATFALRSALDPTIPANGGAVRPVRVLTRPGTIVDARAPAAVGAGNVEVSQRVADVCLRALAEVRSGHLGAASQGTMNNLLVGGTSADGRPWVYYETIAGGQGGRPGGPGMSGVHTAMTNTRNTPVEALERAFPLRVRRLRLRRGSAGAGRHAGGEGIERDLEVLTAATVSLITERRRSAPWGLEGGASGAVGENWLLPGGDESAAVPLPDKCTVAVAPGDVIRVRTPGGGGWGPPVTD